MALKLTLTGTIHHFRSACSSGPRSPNVRLDDGGLPLRRTVECDLLRCHNTGSTKRLLEFQVTGKPFRCATINLFIEPLFQLLNFPVGFLNFGFGGWMAKKRRLGGCGSPPRRTAAWVTARKTPDTPKALRRILATELCNAVGVTEYPRPLSQGARLTPRPWALICNAFGVRQPRRRRELVSPFQGWADRGGAGFRGLTHDGY